MRQNYVVMAAVSSLMKYIEFIQGVYVAEKTMKVRLRMRDCHSKQATSRMHCRC